MSSTAEVPRDLLAYLLKHAHLRLTGLIDHRLAAHDIDSKDFGVLRVIAQGEPKSQGYVAQMLSIDRTTMVAIVDSLEHKGIVTRSPDPADRRRNVVELTEAGRATYLQAAAAHDAAERELVAALSPAARADLATSLRSILTGDGDGAAPRR